MPKSTVQNKLTVKQIENAQPALGKTEKILYDGGNLELRLRKTTTGASKTWQFKFRFCGERDKINIGTFPSISLASARESAVKFRMDLAEGKNPKTVLEQSAAVEHANALAGATTQAPTTVEELFDRWHKEYLVFKRPRSEGTLKRQFEMHVLPNGIAELSLSLFRVPHVVKVLNDIRAAGHTRTCGIALDGLRQMVKYARTMQWMESDPTFGLRKSDWNGQAVEIERNLTEDEVVQLHWRLKKSSLVARWKHLIWLLLATGTRIEETVLTRRKDVNLQRGQWSIPAEHQKRTNTGKPPVARVVYLSRFAVKHMQALLDMPGTEEYLVPARVRAGSQAGPGDSKTLTKALKNLQGGDQKGRRTSQELILEGGTWTPHDLRRTMSTMMQELGVADGVINKCQAHTPTNRIHRIYHRAELKRFMTEAWDALGGKLEELTGKPDPEPEFVAPKPKAIFFDATDLEAVARREKERRIALASRAAHALRIQTEQTVSKPRRAKAKPMEVATVDFGDSELI